jgi:hypothetical protein
MHRHRIAIAGVVAAALGCGQDAPKQTASNQAVDKPAGAGKQTVELVMLYGSEKKTWLDEQIAAFHKSRRARRRPRDPGHRQADGIGRRNDRDPRRQRATRGCSRCSRSPTPARRPPAA